MTKHNLDLEPAKHTKPLSEEHESMCFARFIQEKKIMWAAFKRTGEEIDLESPIELLCASVDEKLHPNTLTLDETMQQLEVKLNKLRK